MSEVHRNTPTPGQLTVIMGKKSLIYLEKIDVDGKSYQFLGAGNYNIAYESVDEPYVVYKQPLLADATATDLPERAIRVWNEINPTMPATLSKNKLGWIAPFVSGERASHDEILNALIDIYQRTGRVVVDAFVTSNFKKMKNGTVVCVDVGAALQLENRLEKSAEQSQVSLDFWDTDMKNTYNKEFLKYNKNYSKITNTTKALLYLKLYKPDVRKLDALKYDFIIKILADAYTHNSHSQSIDDVLNTYFPLDIDMLIQKNPFLCEFKGLGLSDEQILEIHFSKTFQHQHKQTLIFLIREKNTNPSEAYNSLKGLKKLTQQQADAIKTLYEYGLRPETFTNTMLKDVTFSNERKIVLETFVKSGQPLNDVINFIAFRRSEQLKNIAQEFNKYQSKDNQALFIHLVCKLRVKLERAIHALTLFPTVCEKLKLNIKMLSQQDRINILEFMVVDKKQDFRKTYEAILLKQLENNIKQIKLTIQRTHEELTDKQIQQIADLKTQINKIDEKILGKLRIKTPYEKRFKKQNATTANKLSALSEKRDLAREEIFKITGDYYDQFNKTDKEILEKRLDSEKLKIATRIQTTVQFLEEKEIRQPAADNSPGFSELKNEIVKKLQNYIKIAHGGHLGITGLFRTTHVTQQKIDNANTLIKNVRSAKNKVEIDALIKRSRYQDQCIQTTAHKNDWFSGVSRYDECLSGCLQKKITFYKGDKRRIQFEDLSPLT